jgi:hypothetical protein
MDEDLYGEDADDFEDDLDEEAAEGLLDFLREAVAAALDQGDGAAFLEWMRTEAPGRAPELFAELPHEQARRSMATELGRMLWNALPLPANGYRPRPIPRPERNDPCPCGSGRKYKRCCAGLTDAVPVLDSEVIWLLVIQALSLAEVEELGRAGKVPRGLAGELAATLLDDGDALRALALVRPLFDRPERLDERDEAALTTLLEAYDDLELFEEKREAVDRLSRQLKPSLRAVLGESLVRSHAVEGKMEQAWEALEKARRDDPESPALGPLEVTLLLVEGRTREAGERARAFRERFRRDPEATPEAGREFLDKVARDPERAQLEFSLGREVAFRLRALQKLLAKAQPPSTIYDIGTLEDGSGQLEAPESLDEEECGWDDAYLEFWSEDFVDGGPDPWYEDRAERWLGYLLEHPEALDSLDILADVAGAIEELVTHRYASLDALLLRPLLDRGLAILDQSLAARPEIDRLPDDAMTNKSALDLLALAAEQADRLGEAERAQELRTRLRALDPEYEGEDL